MKDISSYVNEALATGAPNIDFSKFKDYHGLTRGEMNSLNKGGRVKVYKDDILLLGELLDALYNHNAYSPKAGSMLDDLTDDSGEVIFEKFLTITIQGNNMVVRIVKEKAGSYTESLEWLKDELTENRKHFLATGKNDNFEELIHVDEIKWNVDFVRFLWNLIHEDGLANRAIRVQVSGEGKGFEIGYSTGY